MRKLHKKRTRIDQNESDVSYIQEFCRIFFHGDSSKIPKTISKLLDCCTIVAFLNEIKINVIKETKVHGITRQEIGLSHELKMKKMKSVRRKMFSVVKEKCKAASIFEYYLKFVRGARKKKSHYAFIMDCFLQHQYDCGLLDATESMLKRIPRSEKSSLEYLYTLGSIYFDKATKVKLFAYSINRSTHNFMITLKQEVPYCRLALKYFREALKKDPKNNTIHRLISACYQHMNEHNEDLKFCRSYELKYGSKHLKLTRTQVGLEQKYGCLKLFDAEIAMRQELARQALQLERYQEAIDLLLPMYYLRPHDFYTIDLLAKNYNRAKRFKEAIKILVKHRNDNPFFCHLIGENLLEMFRFYYASIYFAREMRLLPIKSTFAMWESEILYNFARGMWHCKMNSLNQAKKNFHRCRELYKEKKFSKYMSLKFLPELVDIDRRTNDIAGSTDPRDFIDHLTVAMDKVEGILDTFTSVEKQGVEYVQDPVYLLTSFKRSFLVFLYVNSLKNEAWDYLKRRLKRFCKNNLRKHSYYKMIGKKFEESISWYDKQGFTKDRNVGEGIKAFIQKLGSRKIYEVSGEEWPGLMKALNPSLEHISQRATQYTINIYVLKACRVEIAHDVEKPIKVVGPQTGVVVPDVSESAKKKIRILTNVKRDVNSEWRVYEKVFKIKISKNELTDREKEKKKYLLWLDESKREAFIYSKKKKAQIRDLLISFLITIIKEEGKVGYYEKIFENCTEVTEDYDDGSTQRHQINRWKEEFNKVRNGVLTKHIKNIKYTRKCKGSKCAGYWYDPNGKKIIVIKKSS